MPDDDLVVRAARALQQASACSLGVHIGVAKSIPAQAGMGGGSSDAASTLLALNRLWKLDLSTVQSNIVIFEVDHPTLSPQQLVDRLWEQGIWTFAIGGKRVRAVTNYHVTAEDVDAAARAVKVALRG